MANPTAVFETSEGTFKAEIYLEQMPITAQNFIDLVNAGFYNGLHFHRIIPQFMCQFGCPHSKDPHSRRAGTGGPPHGNIQDEHTARHSNKPGTLSMANYGKDTNKGQFFITTKPTPHLDGKHVVFGRVVDGEDVVKKIESVGSRNGQTHAPVRVADCGEIKR